MRQLGRGAHDGDGGTGEPPGAGRAAGQRVRGETATTAWASATTSLVAVHSAGAVTIEAGSDWLRTGRRWVDTYDLVRVRGSLGHSLEWTLVDSAGRKVKVTDSLVKKNPNLWLLLRNGMEHSIAGGAETNKCAQQRLGVVR